MFARGHLSSTADAKGSEWLWRPGLALCTYSASWAQGAAQLVELVPSDGPPSSKTGLPELRAILETAEGKAFREAVDMGPKTEIGETGVGERYTSLA